MTLAQKKCLPCKKGTPAMSSDEAKAMLTQLSGWRISDDGKWLLKDFKFKDFMQALAFANKVGEIAEAENHHPDLGLGWGYVHIKLQTHEAGGLHENDFIVAAKIDSIG